MKAGFKNKDEISLTVKCQLFSFHSSFCVVQYVVRWNEKNSCSLGFGEPMVDMWFELDLMILTIKFSNTNKETIIKNLWNTLHAREEKNSAGNG